MITLQVQALIGVSQANAEFNIQGLEMPLAQGEMILLEDRYNWILEENIVLNLSNPPCAELEIKEYGWQYFVENARKLLSLPLIYFIDRFGLYRNIYRTLIGVYLTMAAMTLR